ncbi:Endo-beta-mannanase [Limihaloglobus sulfuriphilus]|uniref:Endo-beta-mannanase n=1 Tax=Limihaloglobus sulfuriphilus TaxID=1851148 RepID=A0A1Q2MB27_9BACT|nr:hypothetical protein [Limihaloglobus sulfuriphilus]AQQ69860.1 Endo-beta-mannanase [Limihaloglobus sulfuriphilus]
MKYAALILLLVCAVDGFGLTPRVAFVGENPVLEKRLNESGFTVTALTFDQLCDGHQFSREKYDILLLTDSERFPQDAGENLLGFLREGGSLAALGGCAFSRPLYKSAGRRLSKDEVLTASLEFSGVENCDAFIDSIERKAELTRSCDNMDRPGRVEVVNTGQARYLRFHVADFTRWDTFRLPFRGKAGANALVLTTRSVSGLSEIMVEVRESDSSRWMARVPAQRDWQTHTILESSFVFIPDGSPPNRGKRGDFPDMSKLEFIQYGLVFDYSPQKQGDYTFSIGNAATVKIDLPEGFGKPVTPKRLPIFYDEPANRYKDAVSISRFEENAKPLSMTLSGISAIGYPLTGASEYVPMLAVYDEYQRRCGFAAGALVHYGGEFAGGVWYISGVEGQEFYSNDIFMDSLLEAFEQFDAGYIAALKEKDSLARKERLPKPESKMSKISVSEDGKTLVRPDGKEFFILGVNYIGSFDCKCSQASENFKLESWRRDFAKAREAGINCFRLWIEGLDGREDIFNSIIALAEKYGIYLLLHPTAHPLSDSGELEELFGNLARMAADENAVIGYDLMNEPYITTVGSITIDAGKGAILKYGAYKRYAGTGLFSRDWVESMAKNRGGWPELGDWVGSKDALDLYAAFDMAQQYSAKYVPSKDYSSLWGLSGPMPVESTHAGLLEAVNENFAQWIGFHKKAIRQYDKQGMITVGYNSSLAALEANKSLDMVSHHLYQNPVSMEDFKKSVTTFDRLRQLWPDKPITLGEFGYSSNAKVYGGGCLGDDAAGVGEMMIHLYAFANGYSGAMSWMLSDWPVPIMEYNGPWIAKADQPKQAGFGMYRYDGTKKGAAKPIVHGLEVLSRYIKTHEPGEGIFKIHESDSPIGCGYTYKSADAFFVGDKKYSGREIEFTSPAMVNIMVVVKDNVLEITASRDVNVKINQRYFGIDAGEKKIKLLKGITHEIDPL